MDEFIRVNAGKKVSVTVIRYFVAFCEKWFLYKRNEDIDGVIYGVAESSTHLKVMSESLYPDIALDRALTKLRLSGLSVIRKAIDTQL